MCFIKKWKNIQKICKLNICVSVRCLKKLMSYFDYSTAIIKEHLNTSSEPDV